MSNFKIQRGPSAYAQSSDALGIVAPNHRRAARTPLRATTQCCKVNLIARMSCVKRIILGDSCQGGDVLGGSCPR